MHAGNIVDCTGVLAPLEPVTSVLDDNPLMPSGAALFVSAMVMLLDFSRPRWQPVTTQAKDFVLRCLDMCAPPAMPALIGEIAHVDCAIPNFVI